MANMNMTSRSLIRRHFYLAEKAVCPPVRPSVCLSVKRVILLQNERKFCPDFTTIRKIILPSFLRRRMVGGGDPFYLKFWVKLTPLERIRRFLVDIRL